MGFNSDTFDVREKEGEFMIRCLVYHKEKKVNGISSTFTVRPKIIGKRTSLESCRFSVLTTNIPCWLEETSMCLDGKKTK